MKEVLVKCRKCKKTVHEHYDFHDVDTKHHVLCPKCFKKFPKEKLDDSY